MFVQTLCISIHALREESDYMATAAIQAAKTISIHALREESDATNTKSVLSILISIHALREESDDTFV